MKKYRLGLLLFVLLIIATGCGKKNIVGKWKSTGKDNEYYYTFNKDKTCSYEMTAAKLNCTYEIKKKELIISYDGSDNPITFEYQVKKNVLIIKDERGNENKFKKA